MLLLSEVTESDLSSLVVHVIHHIALTSQVALMSFQTQDCCLHSCTVQARHSSKPGGLALAGHSKPVEEVGRILHAIVGLERCLRAAWLS